MSNFTIQTIYSRSRVLIFLALTVTIGVVTINCSREKSGESQPETSAPQTKPISLDTNSTQVNGLTFSPDGKLLAGAADGILMVWDVQTQEPLQPIKSEGDLRAVAFSPDGKNLAAAAFFMGFGGELKWWDTQTWTSKNQTMLTSELLGRSVAFSPDGKLLAGGNRDGTVGFWDVNSAKKTKAVKALGGVVSFIAFLPNEGLLASGTSGKGVMKPRPDNPAWSTLQEFGEVALVDLSTGKVKRTLATNDNDTTDHQVAFSPDGKLLATRGAEDAIELWDAQSGQLTKSLKVAKGEVKTLAISPDGKTLASAGGDKIIRLWNIASGESTSLTGHDGTVTLVAFSPDGRTLASTSADKTVRLWKIE